MKNIVDIKTGDVHQLRAAFVSDEGKVYVWSKTWKGIHIIGKDCEFEWEKCSCKPEDRTGWMMLPVCNLCGKPIEEKKTGVPKMRNPPPPPEKRCMLSDEDLIKKCDDWVSKLADSGGCAWSLKVPVDFNNDPDMLFCELARRFERTLNGGEEQKNGQ